MKFALPSISTKAIFLGIFLFFLGLFPFTTPVHAIDTQTISAYPTYSTDTDPRSKSWFIYSLPAGVKKSDSVTVVNNGKTQLTIQVYAVDSVKANDGSFALAALEQPRNSIGAWVSLGQKEVTLNPGEHKKIPFTISIPLKAASGEYSGGIVFQLAPQKSTTSKGMAINVVSRVGVRMYETVPSADQLKMSVSNLKYSIVDNKLAITFTIENNGTVHVSPTGVFQLRDVFGRVADMVNLDSQLGVVVPGKPTTITIPTNVLAPIFGWESATVAVYYSPTKVASATMVILPSPWGIFIIALVLLFIAALLILRRKLVNVKKDNSMTLAPRVWVIVGCILLATVACSALLAFLFSYLFGAK